ncbi:MAG: ABC transporter substrate-binding protein, partial [Polyangiaceae bacterium]
TNPVRLSKRLQALHLRSLEIDQRNLPAIYESIRLIGDAAGVPDRATKLIASMRGGLDRIRARSMGLPKVRTMFVVGRSPRSLDGLFIAAKSSFLNDLIQIAGGENVFGNAAGSYPPVSLEEVIARNPEVIIDMGDMSNSETITDAHKRELIDLWGRMSSIAAVKEHRVFPIASNIYLVPGPRVVEAAQAIFKMLHPESQK